MRTKTKHFKIDTSFANTRTFYQRLLALADKWEIYQISSVAFFKAGFLLVYMSIQADRWYEITDANDPDYPGDAQDELEEGVGLDVYHLKSKPSPQNSWIGQWQKYDNPDDLRDYATRILEALGGKSR